MQPPSNTRYTFEHDHIISERPKQPAKSPTSSGIMSAPVDRLTGLADEILLNLISYFTPREVCRMACVSSRFKRLVVNIWSERLFDTQANRGFFYNYISSHPYIIKLRTAEDSAQHQESEETDEFAKKIFSEFSTAEMKTLVDTITNQRYMSAIQKIFTKMACDSKRMYSDPHNQAQPTFTAANAAPTLPRSQEYQDQTPIPPLPINNAPASRNDIDKENLHHDSLTIRKQLVNIFMALPGNNLLLKSMKSPNQLPESEINKSVEDGIMEVLMRLDLDELQICVQIHSSPFYESMQRKMAAMKIFSELDSNPPDDRVPQP